MRQDSPRPKTVNLPDSTSAETRTPSLEDMEGEKNYHAKHPGNTLPGIQAASHRTVSQQPEPNEFADMLEELFAGDPGGDLLPTQFTEIAWEKGEVYKAIKRMKVQKSADECGLVAESFKICAGFFH